MTGEGVCSLLVSAPSWLGNHTRIASEEMTGIFIFVTRAWGDALNRCILETGDNCVILEK